MQEKTYDENLSGMLNIESCCCRLQEHGRGRRGCRVSRYVLSRASPGHSLRARINDVSRVRQHVGWKCSVYVRAIMTLRLQRMTMTRYETIVYLYISYFYERISIIIKKKNKRWNVLFAFIVEKVDSVPTHLNEKQCV